MYFWEWDFYLAKFTPATSLLLLLLISRKLLYPVASLKMSSLLTLLLKSHSKFSLYLWILLNTHSSSLQKLSLKLSILSPDGARMVRKLISWQGPHSITYYILPLINPVLFTVSIFMLHEKNYKTENIEEKRRKDLYLIHDLYFPFHIKMCFCLLL